MSPTRTRLVRAAVGLCLLLGAAAFALGADTLGWREAPSRMLAGALGGHTPRKLPPIARADRALDREGHLLVTGGVVYVPQSFRSEDGAFDLLLHFHGNARLVEESVERAGLNALVYVVNTGISAADYRDAFSAEGMCGILLERATAAATERGLEKAKLRRLALSSWSAGYTAVSPLLSSDPCAQRTDALLMLDSLHAPYDNDRNVGLDRVEPIVAFARRAVRGETLFVLTHSAVEAVGYAPTARTADALLAELGVARQSSRAAPLAPATFAAALAAARPEQRVELVIESEAHAGGFHLMGTGGDQAAHHMAHLIHMSSTALPRLVERWRPTR